MFTSLRRAAAPAALLAAALLSGYNVAGTPGPSAAGPHPVYLAAAVTGQAATTAPALVGNGAGGADLFYRLADGSVAGRSRTGSTWSAPYGVGGVIVGAPAAARAGQSVVVVGRGTDGAVWLRTRGGTGTWSGWQSLGGITSAAPAVAGWSDGRLDVFCRGANNQLYTRTLRPGIGWSGWTSLGGVLTTAPAVAASGSGSLEVAVASTDQAVRVRSLRAGTWSGWQLLGGRTYSAAAVVWDGARGRPVVVVRGTNNAAYTAERAAGVWTGWQSHGSQIIDAPAAAVLAPAQILVVARSSDLVLRTHTYQAGSWSGWLSVWPPVARPAPPASLLGTDWAGVPTTRKVVALTFDAGGNAAGLASIRATLQSRNVPASFFLTGAWTRSFPAESNQVVVGGYLVGNHSDTHPYFTQLTSSQVDAQVRAGYDTIVRTAGADPRPLFRFPYGDVDSRVLTEVNRLGYVAVRWSVDSLGWQGTSGGMSTQKVTDRVVAAARPGAIVLMHLGSNPNDGTTLDAAALPGVIDRLRAAGYGFVTLQALTG
jgi:peptidoglycan/xylan/chitin deacetylase (PgdA/CDA1 family)